MAGWVVLVLSCLLALYTEVMSPGILFPMGDWNARAVRAEGAAGGDPRKGGFSQLLSMDAASKVVAQQEDQGLSR